VLHHPKSWRVDGDGKEEKIYSIENENLKRKTLHLSLLLAVYVQTIEKSLENLLLEENEKGRNEVLRFGNVNFL
jgi:hypothetical protein